jgi:molybdopterin synthase sulfur carrier subunit
MKVRFFATYRDVTGCRELDIPAPSTAIGLLHALADRYGPSMRRKLFTEDGEISEDAILLINGRHFEHLGKGDAPLKDSDVASLFPMVAGG